jgi:hypothetical protein
VTVDYLDLVDYLAIAAEATGLDEQTVVRVVDTGLADSALHASAAGTGETDFYPDLVLAIASGEWAEAEFSQWLCKRLSPPS